MKLLLVYGDGDGGAGYFRENYNTMSVYQEMLAKGVTEIDKADDYDEDGIHIELHEFGDVDGKFIDFLFNNYIIDEDRTENTDFFIIKEEK